MGEALAYGGGAFVMAGSFPEHGLNSIATPGQLKLYVGTGSLVDTMVKDYLKMIEKLKQLSANKIKVKSEILVNETHRTVFGRGFTNGLRFLFEKE